MRSPYQQTYQVTGRNETETQRDGARRQLAVHHQSEACAHETTFDDSFELQETEPHYRSSGFQRQSPSD